MSASSSCPRRSASTTEASTTTACARSTPEQRRGALSFCLQQLGKLYDHAGLLRFLAVLVLRRKPRAWRDRYWFCSELVAAAYRAHGISLTPERPAYTSPADLAISPGLQLGFVIKPEV